MANDFLNKVYDFGVSISQDPSNIKNTGEFVLDTLKGIKSGVEQTAKDLGLISEPIPSNSIVSDRRRPWEKASDEIKDYINILTNENRIGHQQAVQDLVFDLITAYGGGSAGTKAVQMAKPIVSEALNVLKNKGIKAFENFINNKIGQIRYNKVKKITENKNKIDEYGQGYKNLYNAYKKANPEINLSYDEFKNKFLQNNKNNFQTEVYDSLYKYNKKKNPNSKYTKEQFDLALSKRIEAQNNSNTYVKSANDLEIKKELEDLSVRNKSNNTLKDELDIDNINDVDEIEDFLDDYNLDDKLNELKELKNVTFKDLMTNPKYRDNVLRKDYQVITPEDYFRETGKDWELATDEELAQFIARKNDYSMATPDEIRSFLTKDYTDASAKEIADFLGLNDYKMSSIDEFLNDTKTAYDRYSKANEQFKKYVQDFIKTNKKDTSKLSKEEQKLWNLVEQNKEELSKLAQSVGVTSKDEIPKLLKFAKQMNEILKNAPANIKAIASKSAPVTLGVTGLSVYDLYQEFKSGGDNLLPTIVRDASGIASTLLPGGPIAKILYAGLGYVGGDRLTRAAYKKLGLNYENDNMKAEYETGMAYPQLYEFVPEYQTGMSGRKYHVVGDRIYAFDTGKAVNVNQAIEDINQKLAYDDQQILDKTRQVENQINDIQQAIASGYEVPQETVQNVYKQYQELQNAIAQGGTRYNITDYDTEKDLVEQVKAEQTQQPQIQNNQGSFEQSLVDMVLNPPKKAKIDQAQLYKDLFNKIAQQTYDALDNYYSPEGMSIAYNDYQRNTLLGKNLGLTQDQFIKAKKLEAMQQLAPEIQKTAQTLVEKAETENIGPDADTIIKLLEWNVKRTNANETIRNNYANNLINSYKAEEQARANQAGENIDLAKLNETQRSNIMKENIDQYNALSSRMNALTNQQEAQIKQNLVPYQQSNYLGQFLINSSMTDLPMDQILNSNPQLFSKVLPGTATNNQTQINLKPYNQIKTNSNFNIGGNK